MQAIFTYVQYARVAAMHGNRVPGYALVGRVTSDSTTDIEQGDAAAEESSTSALLCTIKSDWHENIMSLRFESKAVLEDNEERPIHSSSKSDSAASSTYVPPVWQQLQANAQAFQENYDETTKERFRGTKLLDEDDVDYLSTLDDAKVALEQKVRREEEDQMRFFRQEQERKIFSLDTHQEDTDEQEEVKEVRNSVQDETERIVKRTIAPIIAVRKVKRKVQDSSAKESLQVEGTTALSNLVGCYDSDESE